MDLVSVRPFKLGMSFQPPVVYGSRTRAWCTGPNAAGQLEAGVTVRGHGRDPAPVSPLVLLDLLDGVVHVRDRLDDFPLRLDLREVVHELPVAAKKIDQRDVLLCRQLVGPDAL